MKKNEVNKEVQKLTLSLLKVFINICEKNNLRYFITGGSLIGVLRHGGFIPWDDDIDIGMPRSDYEKFLKILDMDMPVGYGICNRFTDKNWHFAMSQFVDMESEIEINLAEQKRIAHIWIDVFPLDGLPTNDFLRFIRVKNILIHRYLVQIAHITTQVDAHRKRPIIEKIILKIFKIIPVGKLLNTTIILNHLEKILCKTNYDEAKYVGNMLGRYREKEVVPKKYFGIPKKGTFENIKVNIPQYSDKLLTTLYGNYMELPPKKERVAHNVKIIRCRKE